MVAQAGILGLPTTSRTLKLKSYPSAPCFCYKMGTCRYIKRYLKTSKVVITFPVSTRKQLISSQAQYPHTTSLHATLKRGPKGFGPPSPKKTKKKSKKGFENENNDGDDIEEYEEEERDSDVIPEVVTKRMINRMALTVGGPLFVGLMFFPLFYYLKVGLKIDVPTWVPFIVSFIFFGSALLGISYGIVSASWDPMREGSLLGWTEAQKNWPVFRQSFGSSRSGKK